MICTSFGSLSLGMLLTELEQVDMGEIRIDLLELNEDQVREVFKKHPNLIATCRPDFVGLEKQALLLGAAIESGAAYVDIEVELPNEQKQLLASKAKAAGCKVIVSYHNYSSTPNLQSLQEIMELMVSDGADILKVATMATSIADSARILSLYEKTPKPLVAIAMGEKGRITRVANLFLGAPFSLASQSNAPTAAGQLSAPEMQLMLNILNNDEQ